MYQSKCIKELQLIQDIENKNKKQNELVAAHLTEVNDLHSKISPNDAIVDMQKSQITERDNNIQSLSHEIVNLKENFESEKRLKENAYIKRAELEDYGKELKY